MYVDFISNSDFNKYYLRKIDKVLFIYGQVFKQFYFEFKFLLVLSDNFNQIRYIDVDFLQFIYILLKIKVFDNIRYMR